MVAGALAAAPLPSTPEELLKLPPQFTGADEDEDDYINPQEAEAIPGLSALAAGNRDDGVSSGRALSPITMGLFSSQQRGRRGFRQARQATMVHVIGKHHIVD